MRIHGASPLIRWHVRHVVALWIVSHVAVAATLAFVPRQRNWSPMPWWEPLIGGAATVVALTLTILIAHVDRRRANALLLFANLGYSALWLWLSTSAIAVVLEVFWHVIISALISPTTAATVSR